MERTMRLALTRPLAGARAPRGAPRTSRPQLAATLALSAVAGLALAAGSWIVALGLLVTGALVACGFLRPALFLALVLLVRPLMDQVSGVTAGTSGANIAGGLGVLLVAVLVTVLATSRELFAPRAVKGLVAIVLASALAAAQAMFNFGGPIGLEPVTELVRLAALIAVYVLAANLFATPDRARMLFLLVGISAIVPAIYGVVELVTGSAVSEDADIARVSGTFSGPNLFGAYLALAALIVLFLPTRTLPRWARLSALTVMVVGLAASYSRVGWIMMLVGVVLLGWRQRQALVVSALVVTAALCLAVPTIRERAFPFTAPASADASTRSYESYDFRIDNWRGLLAEWEERPLWGFGLETTRYVNPRKLTGREDDPGGGYTAHSTVVKLLVEGGLLLLAAYSLFLVSLVRTTRRLARERWQLADMARLVYILWAVVIFTGLSTDDPLDFTTLMYALLVLTGSLEGAHRHWVRQGGGATPDRLPEQASAHLTVAPAPVPPQVAAERAGS